jgi:outer membrane protein
VAGSDDINAATKDSTPHLTVFNSDSIAPVTEARREQPRPANTYDLNQCYLLASERNLTVQIARNNVRSSSIDNQTARSSLLPALSYNLGHYFSFGKNIDPVTNTFVFERFSGGFTGVGLTLDLFSGFNKVNLIKQSAYQLESAEYGKKQAELQLLTNVALAYARLLLDKEQLAVERDNIKNTEAQLEIISEKIKVGRSTKYEGYLFSSRYNAERSNLITIQNDSAAAVQNLRQLLNVTYQQPFNIASIDTTVFSEIYAENINVPEFLELVLQKHPAVKQGEMEEQVAIIGEKIAKSTSYPSLSVGGNVSSNYNVNQVTLTGGKIPLGAQLNQNLGQNINISVHVPIFSQLENKNRLRKQRVTISNATLAKEEAKNTVVTNTLQLINEFNSMKEKYYASATAFELNKLSHSLYEEKYRLGQISSMELLNSRDMLNTFNSRYVQSKLQLFFQHQILELLKRY